MRKLGLLIAGLALTISGAMTALAQPAALPAPWPIAGKSSPQEADGYTRYELQAPGSGKFRIIYDITAIRPGATQFFNPIRKGSTASDERVTDRATGKPLAFSVVSGALAQSSGASDLDPSYDYIRVQLAHPVPADGGQGRIRIEKTYEDQKSYRLEGAEIVFDRPLGIKRNAVVLPLGYALTACNYPSQVEQEADGRIKISFFNATPGEAPLILHARPAAMPARPSSLQKRLGERALQTRDIVYALRTPETHTFDIYHDYTEERAGVGRYVNVVRPGSQAANPSARNLDTGGVIPAQLLKGQAIVAAGVHEDDLPDIKPDSEVVVFPFKPLQAGQSIRLRMSETYTDPERYRLAGDELVFDRSLGRAVNAVILPLGWMLTNSTSPTRVSQTEDGRTRLDFINPRPDEIEVLITARRAAAP